MKKCQECGTFSSIDTVFCSVCGKRFSECSDVILETLQPELQYSENEYCNQPIPKEINPELMPLLQRIRLFLEDGEFDRADEYCERVLDIEPTNVEAYIGKLMVDNKCNMREQLKDCTSSIANSKNYAKVIRFGNENQKAFVVNSEKWIQERIATIIRETEPTNAYAEDITTTTSELIEELVQQDVFDDEYEYYIDIVCQYCREELSFTNWQIKEGGLICPMCDAHFEFNEGLRR